uniref:Alpha-galactosidase n=1 Tax=Calcidiscus leptoporus TaxID=127549 RepID=A0A7S0J3B0_9EUKA
MGFNSYMAPQAGEAGLGEIADFLVSSGLRGAGYVYVNTDEGWELKSRDGAGRLQWSPTAYPSGLPAFVQRLHAQRLKFGIYGASSGVTCGEDPGSLYHEEVDAATYAAWGVDFLKSDNCASYALDASVRFAAMRDALNATGARIVYSTEPFAIHPDPEQSVLLSNLWRVGCDISANVGTFLDRADLSDKWAPLAAPGGFNDPDMIAVSNPSGHAAASAHPALPTLPRDRGEHTARRFTLGENRLYFGLWALMKAPLLLSADLPRLAQQVLHIVNNSEVIGVNQDPLGVQARKLMLDGAPAYDGVLRMLPWKVGLEDCTRANERWYTRSLDAALRGVDTRVWAVRPLSRRQLGAPTRHQLLNAATDRCLAAEPAGDRSATVVLLPCNGSDALQQWSFDDGLHTVSSITNAGTGLALAVSNATLRAAMHAPSGHADGYATPDTAYGLPPLQLVRPYAQPACRGRDCQDYDPTQKWYWSAADGKLRHALFTASINDRVSGAGYQLTRKVPTWRHHCLAHVLSDENAGTPSGHAEVWGGPLANGAYVIALVNRFTQPLHISAPFAALGVPSIGTRSSFNVRDLWAHKSLGRATGKISAIVPAHDIALMRLSP